jgi:hypothetical protein
MHPFRHVRRRVHSPIKEPFSKLVTSRCNAPCCYTERHGVELLILLERALWIAGVIAQALVVFRFFREGLLPKYPFFVLYLLAEILGNLVLMKFDLKGRSYADAYRICMSISTIFSLGVAAELYESICKHFPGIGLFRGLLAGTLTALAGLVAVLTASPDIARQWKFPQTVTVVVLRFEGEIFAGALVLTWIFLRFVLSIRQPFRPNVLTHWTIATVYFGVSGLAYLAILLRGAGAAVVYPVNCAMLAIQLGCFIAWFCLMRRAGEEFPAFPHLSPAQVRAVENYNRELMEAVTSLPDQISARQAENRDIPLHRAPLR